MGKGRIVSHEGEGQYVVEILHDRTAIEAELAQLTANIETWTTEKNEAQPVLDEAEAAFADAKVLLDAAINYRDEDGNIDRERIATASKAASAAATAVQIAKLLVSVLDGRLLEAQTRKAELEALPESPERSAWCADYSLELDGEVATVEVPGEPETVLVRPGFDDAAAWSASRDGQLAQRAGMRPDQLFWNAAVLPGWQKWKPTYRLGEITSIDGNLADVLLDNATSSADDLPINPPDGVSLTDVPIDYMDCDAIAFEVGDRVLVQFTGQDASQPTVIGFETDPRPCSPGCYGVGLHGLLRDGLVHLPDSSTVPVNLINYGAGASWELAPQVTPTPPVSTYFPDGKTWRPYRLLSGGGDYIGDQNLLGYVTYCDPSGSAWLSSASFVDVPGGIHATVTLMQRLMPQGQPSPVINRVLFDSVIPCRKTIPGYVEEVRPYIMFHRSNNRHGDKWLFCGGLVGASFMSIIPATFGATLESTWEVQFSGAGSTNQNTLGDGIFATVERTEINQSYTEGAISVTGSRLSFSPPPGTSSDPTPESVTVSTVSHPGSGVSGNWSFELLKEYKGNSLVTVYGSASGEDITYETRDASGTLECGGGSIQYTTELVQINSRNVSLNIGAASFSGSITTTTRFTTPWTLVLQCSGIVDGDANYQVNFFQGVTTTSSLHNSQGDFPSPRLFNGVLWIARTQSNDWIATSQGYISDPVLVGPLDGAGFALNPVTGEMSVGVGVQTWL